MTALLPCSSPSGRFAGLLLSAAIGLIGLIVVCDSAAAQEEAMPPEPSSASTSASTGPASEDNASPNAILPLFEAIEFLGSWNLQARPASPRSSAPRFSVQVSEIEGQDRVRVDLRREGVSTPLELTSAKRDGTSLVIRFERHATTGTRVDEIRLRTEGGRVAGVLRDADAILYRIPLVDTTNAGGAEPEATTHRTATARSDSLGIVVTYPRLPYDDTDYRELRDLQEGEVLSWIAPSLHLEVRRDIRVGAHVLRPGNYSLWLQRGAGGWNLLINERAFAWGTPYIEAGLVGAVDLIPQTGSGTTPLAVAIDGPQLQFVWGAYRWSAGPWTLLP